MSALNCIECGKADLFLSIGFDGMDHHSDAGAGSGFKWVVQLECPHCGRVYILGRVKNHRDFAIDIDAGHFALEGKEQLVPVIIHSQRLLEHR